MESKYRKTICLLAFLLIHISVLAQSLDKNYVRRVDLLKAYESDCDEDLGDDEQLLHRKTWQFYDDLGRPTVEAKSGLNTAGTYSISMTEYDKKGRKLRSWSPFEGGTSADFTSESALRSLSDQWYGDKYGYTQYGYNSLGEPISEMGPGKAWHENGKERTVRYVLNKAHSVRRFYAPTNTISLVDSGYYEAGTLTGEVVTDEDGVKLETYRDMQGNVVLQSRNNYLNTYFVYNDYGQLRYVLSPQYQESGFKDMYAYEYRYDDKGRMVKKKLPGCDMTQYWYNAEDQVVFVQDATLRERHLYRFMLYDDFGRMVIQGVCTDPNRSGITNKCSFTGSAGSFCSTGYEISEPAQLQNAELELVNYYDNYSFLPTYSDRYAHLEDSLKMANPVNAKTFLTGLYQVASNGKGCLNVMYYDINGNLTDSKSVIMDSHFVSVHNDYNFTNNLVQSVKGDYLISGNKQVRRNLTSKLNNHYDERTGLQKSTDLSLTMPNGKSKSQTIQSLSYNGIGQIESIQHGIKSGKQSFAYNVRGLLKDITGKGFSERLFYTDGLGAPCYNGNISSQKWKVDNEDFVRGYKFSYDKNNRLIAAKYGEREDLSNHLNRYNEESIWYKYNGGIEKLQRRGRKDDGEYGKIDNLNIKYSGNFINYVEDDAAPVNSYESLDFKDGASTKNEYCYNGVGALVSDANKGIAHIEYDNLNHLREIQFANGGIIRYVYAADGSKLRTTYVTPVENIVVPINSTLALQPSQILPEDSVDYIGEEVYVNGELDKYLFSGGYASLDASTPMFHYFTTDHLGNVRAVNNEDGTLEQVTHYYPLGGIFADAGLNQSLQPYKFNGKEFDKMHGLNWYDFGARMYDPVLGTWFSMDPLAEWHLNESPFMFCGGNPVNSIDYDGMDYWYTNDPSQIQAFMESYKSGERANVSSWHHLTDSEFKASLYYNDKTDSFWFSHPMVINDEFNMIAMNMGSWRRWRKFAFGDFVNGIDGLSEGAKSKKNASSRIGNNGKGYFKSETQRPFYGNQYVKTYSVNKIGRSLGRGVKMVSVGMLAYEFKDSFQKDNGTIGTHTRNFMLKEAVSCMGSTIGAQAGGAIGSFLCPGIGTIIGGAIGSAVGGIAGDYFYEYKLRNE